jgi:hypothetical protein
MATQIFLHLINFQSFGLMKGCEVNADQLRKAAWRINP